MGIFGDDNRDILRYYKHFLYVNCSMTHLPTSAYQKIVKEDFKTIV
jgi:hypothetical protein